MTDNFASMYQLLRDHLDQYEKAKTGESQDPHERVLTALEHPYMRLPNRDAFLAGLRQTLTAEECRAWFAYPDFNYRVQPLRPEEAYGNAEDDLKPGFQALTEHLIAKGFLTPLPRTDGGTGYMRTYLLYLCYAAIDSNDRTPLGRAIQDFWLYIADVDGSKLRLMAPEHRVLPDPISITGRRSDGRVVMNVEIPDTREVIPSDLCEDLLSRCDHIAVINCVCRQAIENRGDRACEYPIKDVCFLFNEAAYEAIQGGWGKELSRDEARKLLEELRDLGLVQVTSNFQHPLSLCNCCSCCCICLRTMARNEDSMAQRSRYRVRIVRPESCIHCGRCVSACQMGAVGADAFGMFINDSKCIGCGQCVSRCPASVLKMQAAPDAPGPDRYCVDRIYL
ncbi:MAG: 4Fe-4S binding protein [Firmicutes bacterium]|nr:4Fe-4S binding protein [Bacillota bacterium]